MSETEEKQVEHPITQEEVRLVLMRETTRFAEENRGEIVRRAYRKIEKLRNGTMTLEEALGAEA